MYVRKMVKQITNIITGWYRRLSGKKYDFSENRLKICMKCSYKEEFLGEEYCSCCGCPIRSKVLVEDEICLDGRWPNVND